MHYINSRLTRRPIHTYLWLIWSIGCYSYVLSVLASSPGRGAGRANLFFIIGVVVAIGFAVRVVAYLAHKEDREWLFAIYRPEEKYPVAWDTRIAVGLVPILGMFVVLQYLFF